ncbi:MAG: hypothetical protein EOP10_02105 [Proteobacteria bacterium]|nr:MAG: hypothetical protein EOP10_02105 [Pseudomonadota bacterium]
MKHASGLLLLPLTFLISCKTLKTDNVNSLKSSDMGPALNESEKKNPGHCREWSEKVTNPMFDTYVKVLGNADHRLWHYLWHGVRNSWHELSADERKVFTDLSPDWAVPADRMLGDDVLAQNATPIDARSNGSGEDFLYMHHNMISVLRGVLADAGQPCIVSWPTIPDPRPTASETEQRLATIFPFPNPSTEGSKSDGGMEIMKSWENWMNVPENLKGIALGEMGYDLEFTIHNNMHMRWTEETTPVGDRPAIVGNEGFLKDNWKWNNPEYDLLGDTYSSHINRNFWKLHGLIDNYIYRWLAANDYSEIADDCAGRSKCYQWKGKWEGAMPHHHSFKSEQERYESLAESARLEEDQRFNEAQTIARSRLGSSDLTQSERETLEKAIQTDEKTYQQKRELAEQNRAKIAQKIKEDADHQMEREKQNAGTLGLTESQTAPSAKSSAALARFRRAVNLARFIHRASRMDQGEINANAIADFKNPQTRSEVATPSKYVRKYVKQAKKP